MVGGETGKYKYDANLMCNQINRAINTSATRKNARTWTESILNNRHQIKP
ncbi:hypothetical protein JOB18_029303 [Solea senegalensis]|uniref:Uncharacterized protein n=1 Tax=Solea senegalensis TaxID=28829 RepID=A0AAV6QVA9_SOLSE|nr:hypothetical protein JOB18_029303 [Solea senegalensis]